MRDYESIHILIRYGIHAEQIDQHVLPEQPELIEKVATDILTFLGEQAVEIAYDLPHTLKGEERYKFLHGILVNKIKNEMT